MLNVYVVVMLVMVNCVQLMMQHDIIHLLHFQNNWNDYLFVRMNHVRYHWMLLILIHLYIIYTILVHGSECVCVCVFYLRMLYVV